MMMEAAIRNGAARSRNSPQVLSTTTAKESAARAGLLCVTRSPPETTAMAAKP
jgi:hypothetical protein